jgi:hypothetical protein
MQLPFLVRQLKSTVAAVFAIAVAAFGPAAAPAPLPPLEEDNSSALTDHN